MKRREFLSTLGIAGIVMPELLTSMVEAKQIELAVNDMEVALPATNVDELTEKEFIYFFKNTSFIANGIVTKLQVNDSRSQLDATFKLTSASKIVINDFNNILADTIPITLKVKLENDTFYTLFDNNVYITCIEILMPSEEAVSIMIEATMPIK